MAFVQSKSAVSAGPVGSQAVTLTNNVQVGNWLIACPSWGDISSIENLSTFQDNLGNVFTKIPACSVVDTTNAQQQTMYYAPVTVGGASTITATFLANRHFTALAVGEYSGLSASPLDKSNAGFTASPGTGANACATPSVTPTTAGELVIGFFTDCSGGANVYSAGTSPNAFNQRENTTSTTVLCEFEDFTQGAAAALTATCGQTVNHRVIASIATFIPAGGVVPILLPPPIIGLQR